MYVALGIAFGAGGAATMAYYARDGELPMTPWGFRSMAGPIEALGPDAVTILGWALVGVCALDTVAGLWLWRGRRGGSTLGLATTPFAFALAIGFDLPFLLVGVPIRAALLLAGRRSLR